MEEKQQIEQQLHQVQMQRQQFSAQKSEIESALEEVNNAKQAFKIVGNVMVDTQPDRLKADLEEKQHMTELRMKSLDKQEAQLRKQLEELHD